MRVVVQWDLDPGDVGPPELVTVPEDVPRSDVDDWLSDTYGWCTLGWEELDAAGEINLGATELDTY